MESAKQFIKVYEHPRTPLEVWKLALRRHAAVKFMTSSTTKDQLLETKSFNSTSAALLAENMHLFIPSELTQLVRRILSQTNAPMLHPDLIDAYLKSIREEPSHAAEASLLATHSLPKQKQDTNLTDLLLSLKRFEVVTRHGAKVSPDAFIPKAGNLTKLLVDADLELMPISDKMLLVKHTL